MILGNNSNGWIGIGIVQEFLSDQVYDITGENTYFCGQ